MALQKALQGVRVLDLSRLLPGPFLTMVLGDMGADVVKIEDPHVGDYMRSIPPSQEGMSGRFLAVNRNKRSVTLDLKADAGRAAFLRMVEKADVIVETFRPGVMERLGVSYATLREHNPAIILCSVSGFGQTGPYTARPGHDLNYLALAGVLAMGGEQRGNKPAMPGVQIADVAGGAMWGIVGILGALVGKQTSGEGQHLDISMTDGALAILAAEFGNQDCSSDDVEITRGQTTLNGGVACYGIYETKDGRYMSLGALEPKFWFAFCGAVGRKGDMAELIAPADKQEQLRGELQDIFRTKTRDEWTEILGAIDACCEPVLELREVPNHPLHKARNIFFHIDDPVAGKVLQVRTPVGIPEAKKVAPKLGEHTAEVLLEYGFTQAEAASLAGK